MIQPASLIGFAVVSIGLCWAASLALGLPTLLARPWLRSLGPNAERAAAASALSLAPAFGIAVTLLLIERSFAAGASGDHCLVHAHHPHLCVYHGGAWGDARWAVGAVAAGTAMLATLAASRLLSAWRARNARRLLERVAQTVRLEISVVRIAPASSVFCFVTGIRRPRIFFSSAAWARLDDLERRAVIEHENAHVSHGDVWRRILLGMLATLGMPFVARHLVAMWAQATERLCDAWSARQIGDPDAVASALVKLSRGSQRVVSPFARSFVSASTTVERVEALLRNEPDGARSVLWLELLAAGVSAAAILLCAVQADALHHVLETLLASI